MSESLFASVAFVDTETTGLDPYQHEIWEVGMVLDGREFMWQLPVDLGRADARALAVGHFHERRHNDGVLTRPEKFTREFARLTRGCHLAGAVISFDEERLRILLRACGACPEWHYHLVDVEALAAGALEARPPWDSDDLSLRMGVDPAQFERHSALGDARWAAAIYKAVMS